MIDPAALRASVRRLGSIDCSKRRRSIVAALRPARLLDLCKAAGLVAPRHPRIPRALTVSKIADEFGQHYENTALHLGA